MNGLKSSLCCLFFAAVALPLTAQTVVNVNGTGSGLTFEGIGAVSAGGSSRLLIDYPEPQRSQILDYLFKPNYGASLQHLKVELGGDMDSTAGAEPSHMHSATDLNFNRGYELWLMQQAKLRNPNITFGALAWGAPGWIGNGNFFSQDMINYIVAFIQGAQSQYGITISDIGIWNETDFQDAWIIQLKNALLAAGLTTQVVAADQSSNNIITALLNDPSLVPAVDVIGFHYPSNPQPFATPGNKPIWATEAGWASESGPLKSNWVNAQYLANIYNIYYLGNITRTEVWSLITSYYDFLPTPDSGLMYANTPWSGNYTVQPAIWATAQTTQFAQPGWQYISGACGQNSLASWVTLKNNKDYSVIIETSGAGSSQPFTFNISGGLSTGTVHVWTTDQNNQFVQQNDIVPVNGSYTLTLAPQTIYSLTTTTGQSKGTVTPPPPAAFPLPYSDNFESYSLNQEAKYFSTIDGSYEIVPCAGGRSGQCYRQMVTQLPILWHEAPVAAEPAAFIGSTGWTNYQVSADVYLEQAGAAKLIGRAINQSINTGDVSAYQFYVSSAGAWSLNSNDSNVLASGAVSFPVGVWHTLSLSMNGSQLQGSVDGVVVANVSNVAYSNGMAGIGMQGFTAAQFDNFRIDLPSGSSPIVPQAQISATATSSAAGYPPYNAVDGYTNTYWETNYTCTGGCVPVDPLPQSITLNLGGSYALSSLQYLPIQNNTAGSITAYNIYTSTDGVNFSLLTSGTWAGDSTLKTASLGGVTASYVQLQATAGVGGLAAAAEINITLAGSTNPQTPVINTITPATVTAGGSSFSVAVAGLNFTSNSVVKWNGTSLPTQYGSATSLTATVPAADIASAGSGTLTVYTPPPGGGTSNPVTLTISQGSSGGGGNPGQQTPFITSYGLTSPPLRNDFTGWVGMAFTVGSNPLYVGSLGRICVGGNSQTHSIKLVNATSNVDVAGSTVSVNMASCASGTFVYANLPSTITLAAGGSYYLASAETLGGDQWYDSGGIVTTKDAAVTSAIYQYNGSWVVHGAQNASYVPANFQYSTSLTTANPQFSVAAGTYTSAQSVALTDSTSGAVIYYTTNGTTPTTQSSIYSSPLSVSTTTTIQAIAVAPGYGQSAVSSATYTIQPPAAAPVFTPAGGTYTSTQSVALTDSTANATVYYTTNGAAPTTSSSIYTAPITVSATTTIQAIAVASGYSQSPVSSAAYTIQAVTAAPAFTPAGGAYTTAQSVTLTDSTANATIYYTTNGTTPTTASTPYTAPISVSATTTIQAIAVAPGYAQSTVSSATYTIQTSAAPPVFTPAGGTYAAAQSVALTDSTPNATIYYTTNGTTPTTASTAYTAPISVSTTTTIVAMAVAPGYLQSAVSSATYTIKPVAAAPVFSPSGGTYTSTQSVTLTDSTVNATIYYTTNGATPTTSSLIYTTPISVSSTTTVQAIAVAPGYSQSTVSSATYTIQPPAAAPVFTPAGGTYATTQSVTLTDSTANATIYYTTNGATPTTSSSVYSAPISVSATTTVQAIAVASGYSQSPVSSATYTIQSATVAPLFTPAGGTYSSAQSVALSDTTNGAVIYYTTNGTTPTTGSTIYTAPIYVTATTTIQAIAVAPGYNQSAVSSATYTILTPAAAPTFTPAGGTYSSVQSVALSDSTSKATIYYTTDGTTPTTQSAVYSSPISVSATTTIKAIATAPGSSTSAVSSATYTIQLPSAAAPAFSVPAGIYSTAQAVALSDATTGATIYYTIDGSTPTAKSTAYSTPITVSATTTINAIAVASGYSPSAVASATYAIQAVVPKPFVTGQTTHPNLRTDFSGWVGMNLTVGANPLYVSSVGRICVAGNTATHTVKFVDAATGADVAGTTAQVNMAGCTGGLFVYSSVSPVVTLTAGHQYYLVSQETAGGDQWYDFGTVTATADATINTAVYSYQGNWFKIAGLNMSYVPPNFLYTLSQVTAQASAPAFSPGAGTYTAPVSVTLSTATSGATIYYTTDGSTPTTASNVYSAPIMVNSTTTITAIATAAGFSTSTVSAATFTIQAQTPTPPPTFSPAAGTYLSPQSVTLTDSGATIYYTTNGSTPTTASTVYSAPIPVSATTTINAIAVAPGMSASSVASATYTISSVSGTNFVTGYGLGGQSLRSDFSGWVGMKFTVGSNALTVSSLGRLCVAGNSGTHTVELVIPSTGAVVSGGSVSVNMAGCTAGQFVSQALTSPITAAAGASYYLVSQETAGGDKWYDLGTISTQSGASVTNAVYSATGSTWTNISGQNTSYVPPTFTYLAVQSANPPFVAGFPTSNPASRNDFSGWVGMKLTVGSTAVTATYVGRACLAGNAASHTVKFVDGSTGADVAGGSASVNLSGCTAGGFVYATLPSPISLTAGKLYYLVSQEVAGGDLWYDVGTITTSSAASVGGAIYSNGGAWSTAGGTNTSYVPPNFK